MDTHGPQLAETYLEMLNSHEPEGIPASGHAVEMRSIDIWRVQDGMFVEHWDELNLLEVLQQVGAVPPFGGSPDGDA
jgi:predicted SnoaL-like aldol condensation-catalyzing enzyme